MFCLVISPARYSDARIDNARIVIVGFCHPALVKLAPSTTNRFLWSWLWHHLFNTLRFGSSPMRQVPTSWILYPGGLGTMFFDRTSNPAASATAEPTSTASFAMLYSFSVYLVSTCSTGIPQASTLPLLIRTWFSYRPRTSPIIVMWKELPWYSWSFCWSFAP